MIERILTEDGRVGWDRFGQLVLATPSREGTVFTFVSNVAGWTCAICDRGWEMTGKSFADQVHWGVTDSVVHETCLERHTGLLERALYRRALIAAQVRFGSMRSIPNGYLGSASARPWPPRPWYRVSVADAPITFVLGRRKRVDHVEVVPTEGELLWWPMAQAAFVDEDVTKSFGPTSILLHAWSDEDVCEYVAKLAAAASLPRLG